jgi:putative membrane protein insertion efficiency factor
MREILVLPIRGYQRFLSPALPRSCRYHPSCSQYAIDALRSYGVFRGSVLAVWRIMRCNPFSDGGYDPVEKQRLFRHPVASTGSGAGEDLEARTG